MIGTESWKYKMFPASWFDLNLKQTVHLFKLNVEITPFVMVSSGLYTFVELVLRKWRASGYTWASTDLGASGFSLLLVCLEHFCVKFLCLNRTLGQAPMLFSCTPCTIYIFSHMNEPPQFIQSFFLHIFFKLGAHGVSHTLRLCHTRAHPLCASPTQWGLSAPQLHAAAGTRLAAIFSCFWEGGGD